MRYARPVGAAAFIVLLSTSGAFAQTAPGTPVVPDRSVEIFGSVTRGSGRFDSAVDSLFAAPFLYTVAPSTSRAEQSLTIAGDGGPGFEVGLNLFPSRHVGLQVRFERSRGDIGGANGPYVVHLDYVAMLPPSYTPVHFAYDVDYPWPDTAGTWRSSALSFNPVVRVSLGRRITAMVSGGLTYLRVGGTVAPLALSTYWLGGHSALFSSVYRLRAEATGVSKVGLNGGGGVSVALTPRVALLADLRGLYASRADLPLRVTAILNPTEILSSRDLEFVRSAMGPAPGPMPVDPTRFRFAIGAQVSLFRRGR